MEYQIVKQYLPGDSTGIHVEMDMCYLHESVGNDIFQDHNNEAFHIIDNLYSFHIKHYSRTYQSYSHTGIDTDEY